MRLAVPTLLLAVALSGCRGREQGSTTSYQERPANHAEVSCPFNRFNTFEVSARRFAEDKGLKYQGRADNESGTKFVIILEDEHQEIWLTSADSPPMLSQHLAVGISPSPADKQLFDGLVRALHKCGV